VGVVDKVGGRERKENECACVLARARIHECACTCVRQAMTLVKAEKLDLAHIAVLLLALPCPVKPRSSPAYKSLADSIAPWATLIPSVPVVNAWPVGTGAHMKPASARDGSAGIG
jgi:hypothetical protein